MIPSNDIIDACLGFLHNVQNERGLAALFLCSRGKQGSDELNFRFAATDASATAIREPLQAGGMPRETLFRSVQALPQLRRNILAQHVLAFDVIEQYTKALVRPALALVNDLAIRNPAHRPARLSAFLYLLQWQERLAREREMVTQLAGQEWMHDEAFAARLKNIIRERQAYERLFWNSIDETQRLALPALKSVMAEGRAATKRSPLPQDKFSFFNARISALADAARTLAALLADEHAAPETLSASGQGLDTEVEAQVDMLRMLPVFRGLGTSVLRDLLRPARIVHHDRNSVLITQTEITGRFYVILDGWVKTYTSTGEGDESILQILGRRECVMDSDVLQPMPAPFSAKAVTRVKLLSIPASFMRDAVARHRDLALNMLAASTRRSQKLIAHFEQLTLRSAAERLGIFLLHLNLETGIGGPPLILPFDKSLIAAYLGIKPETFSRLLKDLRAKGFGIERNHIALPEPYALCDYCDHETMQKCDLADTPSCPRMEAHDAKTG